ncbi:TlpA disulfide reductase family protein [Methanosarcina sp. KYL-1]|uniref:TlpA family protein disulfide reductase n=1 Tax=Methanosarcina sp. KYL-1 TaxID=2602068 RepID=UPI002101A4D4|nr:TlpA disulfide reductase family protein [Methanosarcina sp. KYL-1]
MIFLFLLGSGYAEQDAGGGEEGSDVPDGSESPEDTVSPADWMDYELADARTGETFMVSDFRGKPVLLETFAVWCPTCLKQQEAKKMFEDKGDEVVHISLDVDPNENAEIVRNHMESNGFEWYSSVAPPEMTRELINEFGITVINAPSASVVLVCEDQSARLLEMNGVKPVSLLEEEIEKGC